MSVLPASYVTMWFAYPRRDLKDNPAYSAAWQPVAKVMSTLTGTPCCVQMCQALNVAGVTVPGSSYRRSPLPSLAIYGTRYNYLPATDELEYFLTSFGDPEVVSADSGGNTISGDDVKAAIAGRTGLLIFRWGAYGQFPPADHFEHTELWDGQQTLQRDMNDGYLFSVPRILFWQIDP